MMNRDVPKRMTLSREAGEPSVETEPRQSESRESALSIEVRPAGSNAAIKIEVPSLDDTRADLATDDDARSEFATRDDEPTAITSTIGARMTPLPARSPSRSERPGGRMTMSPLVGETKKGGA